VTGPAVPPGGEEVREEIAQAIADADTYFVTVQGDPIAARNRRFADAVLALPAVRDALAAQEKVRRVEAEVEKWAAVPRVYRFGWHVDRIRRALDGDS
jgi:hypothetical protein